MSDDASKSETAKPETKPAEPSVTDELVTTRHRLQTPEGELAYSARAGRVVLWEEKVEDDVFRGR